jgi:hypothetical protein
MADNKKSNKGLDIPQTKGTFQLQGITTGTLKDSFYKETLTKTQKPWRMINFGIQTDKETSIYINLNGGEKDEVYFSKTTTVDNKKSTEIEKVAWRDRFKFNKEGYKLIGVNVGVKKKLDDKTQKTVNDKKVLSEYDACKEIGDNLKDDQSLFVKGHVEYSHFDSNGNTKRSVKFIPSQVSLCKDVDFEAEKFEPTAFFTQTFIFNGIEQDPEDKTRFKVSGKIVGYNSIEDAEFIIISKDLALQFKKGLKPYWSITVNGTIHMSKNVEEVTTTDCWGEKNKMDKVNAPMIRELIITGADPNSIDKETYSEAIIDAAVAKISANKKAETDFGGNVSDNWGSTGSVSTGTGTSDNDDAWD